MERRFYIGDGPRNNQLVQMVLEKIACCRAAREKLALDFGAVKSWEYKGRITGIAYCKRMEGFPWLTFVRPVNFSCIAEILTPQKAGSWHNVSAVTKACTFPQSSSSSKPCGYSEKSPANEG